MLNMVAGPSYVATSVREAAAVDLPSPDIHASFLELYANTTKALAQLMETENEVFIMGGEGILGLEAACASLIEKGDQVLCLDNGIFGAGFKDFAQMYGAETTILSFDYKKPIDVDILKNFLDSDSSFKMATMVHCETPTAITNDISTIAPLLKSYGILTVVDTVSGVGGEAFKTDKWQVDIALCGSQKCLSAQTGLTFLSVSPDAFEKMEKRKSPIASYYANIMLFKGWQDSKSFPYTMPHHLINGLYVAAKRLLSDEKRLERHKRVSAMAREALPKLGFTIHAESGFSNTVTAAQIPSDIDFPELYLGMLERGVHITSSLGPYDGKLLRIGHMGENCTQAKLEQTLKALELTVNSIRQNKHTNR